jgi:hypothetical protein
VEFWADEAAAADHQVDRFPLLYTAVPLGPTGCRVRKPLGRDMPNSLTRMVPRPGLGRSAAAGFGMGSVRRGGSVSAGRVDLPQRFKGPLSVLGSALGSSALTSHASAKVRQTLPLADTVG